MLHSINNLAFRVPTLAGTALFVAGCYTLFSHPASDLLTQDPGTDCESCHSTGFAAETFASPYSYTATPFFDYYEVPWWIPSFGEVYSGEGEGQLPATPVRGGRHVGSRGQRGPAPVTHPVDSEDQPVSRTSTETKKESPTPSSPAESGPQPGRTMKEDPDQKAPAPKKEESTGDSSSKTKSDDPEGREW